MLSFVCPNFGTACTRGLFEMPCRWHIPNPPSDGFRQRGKARALPCVREGHKQPSQARSRPQNRLHNLPCRPYQGGAPVRRRPCLSCENTRRSMQSVPFLLLALTFFVLLSGGCASAKKKPSPLAYPNPWIQSLVQTAKEPGRSLLQAGYKAFTSPPQSGGLGCIRCHSLAGGEYFRMIPRDRTLPPLLIPTLYSAYAHLPGYVYNRPMNLEMAVQACLKRQPSYAAPRKPRAMEPLLYFIQALSSGQRIATEGGKLPCLGCHSPKHSAQSKPGYKPHSTLHALPKRWVSQRLKNCQACHLHPWKLGGLTSLGFAIATNPGLNISRAEKAMTATSELGARLFLRKSPKNKTSCSACHPSDPLRPFLRPYRPKDLAFAKTRTPIGPNGEVLTLRKRILLCIHYRMGGDPTYATPQALLALEAFVASLATGREFRLGAAFRAN